MEKNALKALFGNRRLTCHFSIILLIFSLIITSSAAWFTMNRETAADDFGMSLEVDDTSAVYRAYVYDLKLGYGVNEKSDGTPIDVTNLDLNQYDTLFRTRNRYTPAFAQINLIGNKSMPRSGTVYITIERNTEGLEEGKLEYTSNIARFTAFIIHGTKDADPPDVEITDPALLYTFINTDERFKAAEEYRGNATTESKTFITATGEGENHTHEQATSITISVDYTEDDWYEVVENDISVKHLNVYLYITYDTQLIDCYMEEVLGNELSLNNMGIAFGNDLEKITISYDKNGEAGK